jgi:hypothetical protein
MDKTSSKLKVRPIVEAARESAIYIDERRKGIVSSLSTPWKKYNQVAMGGIEWGTIHTIAGMSGSGKTAIINQLETHLVTKNSDVTVLSFNFEMLARNLVSRKFASALDLSTQELHSGIPDYNLDDENYNRVVEAGRSIAELPIYYVEEAGTVPQVEKTIIEFLNEHSNVVVMLDHTLLVHGNKEERQILVDLYTMFNKLKKATHEVGKKVSFVILSQLNGDIERAERQAEPSQQFPKKKDLFGSSAAFMFSDVVMVSMNPEQMGFESYGPKHWPVAGKLYWHFLKVREGEPCVAVMANKLKYSRVEDCETY